MKPESLPITFSPIARHAAAAVVLIGLGIVVTSDAWADVFRIAFRDDESSHVLLAPIAAVWLVLAHRDRLNNVRPDSSLVGPLFVAAGWVGYSVGDTFLWQSIWHGGAVLVAAGCLLTAFGSAPLVRVLPAFVALAFLVPVPARLRQEIAIPLGLMTAAATEQVLLLMGIAVQRSGNLLGIGGVEVAVAEACNGLRMLMALALVGYTFAFIEPMSGARRSLVLLGIPILAILCNVVRLVSTVWLYGHRSQSVAEAFHEVSGWVMLVISFVLLIVLARVLRRLEGALVRLLPVP